MIFEFLIMTILFFAGISLLTWGVFGLIDWIRSILRSIR